MSQYTDTLAALRKARADRDNANRELHQLKITQLRLTRSQRKADRGETVHDPALSAQVNALQNEAAAEAKKIGALREKINGVNSLRAQVTALEALIAKLQEESASATAHIAAIGQLLQSGEITLPKRKALESERTRLQEQVSAIAGKIPALQAELEQLRQALHQAEGAEQKWNAERITAEARLAQLEKEIARLAAQAESAPDQKDGLAGNKRHMADAKAKVNAREEQVRGLINELFLNKTPQQLIEEWSDGLPILLLPLRIETRFRLGAAGNQLWVRVFPDEIAVNTHEKILTDTEIEFGRAYWTALFNAAAESDKKEAWRILADKFGSNRSAWVALQTKPQNWDADPLPASAGDLLFPVIDSTKPDSWSEAPHSRVMPDRFVLMAYRAGALVHSLTGLQVKDEIVLGPAPLDENDQPSIQRDAEKRLQYGDDFKWVIDFDTAVSQGLGFKLNLSGDDVSHGFDQLLVIGLKHSADENDGKQLVEDLFDNHHYSKKGLAFVPQGTATNNTDGEDAGHDSNDFLHDKGYFTETGNPLFTQETDPLKISDGQRLAAYLGINPSVFQYVSNSGIRDHAEAVAMNRALYAGTLGYYVHTMMHEVLSNTQAEKLRNLFCNHVTGRGPLPSLRVGKQPYGILLAGNSKDWKYPLKARVDENGDAAFLGSVNVLLKNFSTRWAELKPQLAHISKSGNPGANLMSVLGMQPTSAEYYQRVGYSFDYLKNLEEFGFFGENVVDVLLMAYEQANGLSFLRGLGYSDTRSNGTDKPVPLLLQLIFRHYNTQLNPKNLVDNTPFSETDRITPYDKARDLNYIDWLIENAGDADKLEKRDFGSRTPKPNTLLFMLLQHALLHEAQFSIHRLLSMHDIGADELLRSRPFLNMSSQPDLSPWEVFRAPANRVIPAETTATPLLQYVLEDRFTTGIDFAIAQSFSEAIDALKLLRDLPTARLERVLAEHIDTLNYRLDAWQTALFDERIRGQRFSEQQPAVRGNRSGIYLGAYGYLEKVKADTGSRVKVAESVLPQQLREGKENLYTVPAGGGYVHTPSLNHAAASAILRNGYLTHASPAEREKLTVNLSSERVRRAMLLVEGIRNGQTIEALLGYQFERGMHDWTTRNPDPVFLNQLKPIIRKAFPIKRTKIPQQGVPGAPAETINDYHVVNGLAIAEAASGFPAGIPDLPALSNEQKDALKAEKDKLENSLDALRDLLISESAYQLALGNFDRAAAVMQAVSGGHMPTEIEVIESARGTDLAFTNRFVVHFDPATGDNPWPAAPFTQRAVMEPGINRWAASLLGDPAKIGCTVRAVDKDGITIIDAVTLLPVTGTVSLAELGIQAIDFVHIIRNRVDKDGESELESRVRFAFARQKNVDETTVTEIAFGNSGSNDTAIRSFAEVIPLADYIRQVVAKARPAHARDYVTASKKTAQLPDNPGNVDIADLKLRVLALRPVCDGLFTLLDAALANAQLLKTAGALDALRDALAAVAGAGMVHAWPRNSWGYSDEMLAALEAQVLSLKTRYEAVRAAWITTEAKINLPAAKPQEQIRLLTEMAQLHFGEDFRVLPRFQLWNPEDAVKADADRDQLLKYMKETRKIPLPMDEWLHGVALVRPAMHSFQLIQTISESLNGPGISCSPMQLPWRKNDSWLGGEFAPGTSIVHDTLSVVQYLPEGFSPTGTLCGLLVDEWSETMPNKEEVTGISFHFNQPDSAPPQTLLLAVTPEITGHWKWNNLVASVLDTFERAKLRAVEPEQLETLPGISTLIPTILSEFSTGKSTISLDFAANLDAIKLFYETAAISTFTIQPNS